MAPLFLCLHIQERTICVRAFRCSAPRAGLAAAPAKMPQLLVINREQDARRQQ
jgi:hypothetical protein